MATNHNTVTIVLDHRTAQTLEMFLANTPVASCQSDEEAQEIYRAYKAIRRANHPNAEIEGAV